MNYPKGSGDMLSPEGLKGLMDAADEDPYKVGEALCGILDAHIYHYVRAASPTNEAGIFQYSDPSTGTLIVPFFSDEQRAKDMSRGKLSVVPCLGRTFFEQTLGSTLLLDPRMRDCTLFPGEIAALLAGAFTSGPLRKRSGDVMPIAIADIPTAIPMDLSRALRTLYESMPAVHACYVSVLHHEAGLSPSVLLIVCNAELDAHPSVKEATLDAAKSILPSRGLPFDLLLREPNSDMTGFPAWCIYRRS
jgi:hypothetical protein